MANAPPVAIPPAGQTSPIMYPDDNTDLETTNAGGFLEGLAGLGTTAAQWYQALNPTTPNGQAPPPARTTAAPSLNLWVIGGLAVAGVIALVLLLRGK